MEEYDMKYDTQSPAKMASWERLKDPRDRVAAIVTSEKVLSTTWQGRFTVAYRDIRESHPYTMQNTLYSPDTYYFAPFVNDFPIWDAPQEDTINAISSVISTFVSKQASNKPRISVLTEDGNFEQQKTAKFIEKFIAAEFRNLDFYKLLLKCIRSAATAGIAIIYVGNIGNKIKIEEVPMFELLVDPFDAQYGNPRQTIRRRYIPKTTLASYYPEHANEIMRASSQVGAVMVGGNVICDVVKFYETWKIAPFGSDECGHYHACIDSLELDFQEYTRPSLPFAKLLFEPDYAGYFGYGLSRICRGVQSDLNDLNNLKHEQATMPNAMVSIDAASKDPVGLNDSKSVLLYKSAGGAPPVVQAIPTVNPGLVQALSDDYSRIYDIAGVSQMAVGMRKPSGLNSGDAIQEFNDLESERYQHVSVGIEGFSVDVAKKILDTAKFIAEEYGSYDARAIKASGYEKFDFKKIDWDESKYWLSVYPAGFLPTTPGGKLDKAIKLVREFPEYRPYALSMMDFPDIESINSIVLGPTKAVMALVEKATEGDTVEVDGVFNIEQLSMLKTIAYSTYCNGSAKGYPEEVQNSLLNLVSQSEQLIQQKIMMAQQQMVMSQQMTAPQQQAPQQPI